MTVPVWCGICHVLFLGRWAHDNLERHLLLAHGVGIDRGSHRKVTA